MPDSLCLQVVTPGDAVMELPEEGIVRIGTGMHVTHTHVVAQKSGVVRQTGKGQVWIDGRQKR
jgi:exosome complex component RRP40